MLGLIHDSSAIFGNEEGPVFSKIESVEVGDDFALEMSEVSPEEQGLSRITGLCPTHHW
jgi:hypothetical protein